MYPESGPFILLVVDSFISVQENEDRFLMVLSVQSISAQLYKDLSSSWPTPHLDCVVDIFTIIEHKHQRITNSTVQHRISATTHFTALLAALEIFERVFKNFCYSISSLCGVLAKQLSQIIFFFIYFFPFLLVLSHFFFFRFLVCLNE